MNTQLLAQPCFVNYHQLYTYLPLSNTQGTGKL